MPVDRPTFSESWFRVAQLRPTLRPRVQVFRQHYRGRIWHVVQDSSSNQYYRLNQPAYHFVALLDGKRSVSEAWRICNDDLGDAAPTQGEAIQLLGQLYTSNLLRADLPPDAEGMFRRYRKRTEREVRGYLMSLLFLRIPLYDPESFLNRWVKVFGMVFTWIGFAAWAVVMAAGIYFVAGRWSELFRQGGEVLNPENLPYLYLAFVVIKLFHEFGHGFACKKFGRQEGVGGEVHTMGIMFLVFMPVPYVDASSAWAFRNKWHRVAVGLSGMYVELALAALAAIVWANVAPGDLRTIAYNVMFIASVSSILFNGNPLLRYDAYYVLSDLLETPNLAQRSKGYLYYLVKRYVYGVRRPNCPAHSPGEKGWFVFYALASTAFRVFISVRILLFVADKLFFAGAILAALAVVGWVMVPFGRWMHYLYTSGELSRTRGRAVAATAGFLLLLAGGVGAIPVSDHVRCEGFVEPGRMAVVHSEVDGELVELLDDGSPTGENGDARAQPALFRLDNLPLRTRRPELAAEIARLRVQQNQALEEGEQVAVDAIGVQIDSKRQELELIEQRIAALAPEAEMDGLWYAPEASRRRGAWIRSGEQVGMVIPDRADALIVRAVAQQDAGPLLIEEILDRGNERARRVEIRVKGRPDLQLNGRVAAIPRSGTLNLPSKALGYQAGGSVAVSAEDPEGRKAAERLFEIRIDGIEPHPERLRIGQRVVVRFTLPAKPLAVQWWRKVRQLVLRRFRF